MKRYFIFTLCLPFLTLLAFGQQESIKYYFRGRHLISNPDSADYYRVIDSKDGANFRFTEYHKDGTTVKATATGTIADPQYNGTETIYYKNGRIAVKNEYQNGRCLKTVGYYPNGILLQVINYRTTWPFELVAYDADSSGRVHIINGNGSRQETDTLRSYHIHEAYTMTGPYKDDLKDGVWKGTDDRGFLFEETYEAGKLIAGTTKTESGKKYHYMRLYEYPKFKDDIDQFERHIIPNMVNVADTTGLAFFKAGFLKLRYIINADGSVSNITGFARNKRIPVSIAFAKPLPKCEPARLRGVPINYTIINNADYLVRHNFSLVFNTSLTLNGVYTPGK